MDVVGHPHTRLARKKYDLSLKVNVFFTLRSLAFRWLMVARLERVAAMARRPPE